MDRNDQAWAVFRCQLLAPVLLGEVSASERGAYFRMLSEQEHLLPNGTRKKISQRTLRRWWKRLREGGVEATGRKRRSDRGQPHRRRDRSKILARAVQQQLLAFFLLAALGFFGPDVILNRRIAERRESMRRDLPDMLDLLVISVEAGLGFDSALNRVVNTVPGPLSEEFFRMLQETRVGVARRDAMRHLTERTDVDELRSFLLAMMQAEAFGVAIARVLRVQADEMRVARRQRAQEKAFAAPVKLVFPLVFCIFPALFIVLLGPAAIQIYETFTGL